MKKILVLLALIAYLLWATVPVSAEAVGEVLAARILPRFTVWRLWHNSDYRQIYDWPSFVREVSLTNGWSYNQLSSLPVGTIIVLPKADTEYVTIDADRCRLSPLSIETPVSLPLLPTTPKSTTTVPSSLLEEVTEPPLMTAVEADGLDTLSLELANLKLTLSQELTEAEARLMASLEEFKAGLTRDLAEQDEQLTSPLETQLTRLETEFAQVRQAVENLSGTETVSADQNEVGLSWWAVITTTMIGLTLVMLTLGLWQKKRQIKEERRETENALAMAAVRSEAHRKRLSLAQSYGWKVVNFRLPDDLRTDESPESIPLIEVIVSNDNKKSGRIRPKVLAPCFMDKDTEPIYLDNLPNHLRHCLTCRQKLSLQESEPATV